MPIIKHDTDESEEMDMKEDREDNEETALLPKSLLLNKDVAPGDEVILKVVHVYDDEVEVAYGKGKDKDKGEDRDTMEGADAALDEMATDTMY